MIKAIQLKFKPSPFDDSLDVWIAGFGYRIEARQIADKKIIYFIFIEEGLIQGPFRTFQDAETEANKIFQVLTSDRIDKEHLIKVLRRAIELGYDDGLGKPSTFSENAGHIPNIELSKEKDITRLLDIVLMGLEQ